jgi:hypothetical protein
MIAEVDIAGIYVAPIVVYALAALPIFLLLRVVLARLGFWRAVWHPALVETALYLSILSLLVLL